jgi:hypothetical protein
LFAARAAGKWPSRLSAAMEVTSKDTCTIRNQMSTLVSPSIAVPPESSAVHT